MATLAVVFRSVDSNKISYFRRASFFDMVGVTGSIPVAPTTQFPESLITETLREKPALARPVRRTIFDI
jgi:hypothetical protein